MPTVFTFTDLLVTRKTGKVDIIFRSPCEGLPKDGVPIYATSPMIVPAGVSETARIMCGKYGVTAHFLDAPLRCTFYSLLGEPLVTFDQGIDNTFLVINKKGLEEKKTYGIHYAKLLDALDAHFLVL